MKKPVCLLLEDFKDELANIVNRYHGEGVPLFCLEPIVKDIYNQVIQAKAKEIAIAKKNYVRESEEYQSAESNNQEGT